MMNSPEPLSLNWPALADRPSFPDFPWCPSGATLLSWEWAVWGKVHGQPSDFRWIARSPGFARFDRTLEHQLSVGTEDRPRYSTFWRALPDCCYAVVSYPSRARDAANRSGFLEKQIIAWPRTDVPAALAALLLLPRVATFTDDVWWNRFAGQPWGRADFALPIDENDCPPIAFSEREIAEAIGRGIEALKATVDERILEQLYAQLLAGRRPAWLRGLDKPLVPEAQAVLLLPLARQVADHLSLAGWIPSNRAGEEDLASRWDVLVEPAGQRFTALPESEPPSAENAWALAQALLNADPELIPAVVFQELRIATVEPAAPQGPVPEEMPEETPAEEPWDPFPHGMSRPGLELPLSPLPEGALPIVQRIYAFARAADRRWLRPQEHERMQPLEPDDPQARRLVDWVAEVEKHRPPGAHEEQWAVKVDLLRAAALVLVPDAATVAAVGELRSDRVPPLCFLRWLDPRSYDRLERLGIENLDPLIERSLGCPYDPFESDMKSWIENWSRTARNRELKNLLAEKLLGATSPMPIN